MTHPKIYEFIRSHYWAIEPSYMNTILAVVNGQGDKLLAAQIADQRNEFANTIPQRKDLAVINVRGVIMPYANLFTAISGGVSVESISAQFETAMNDPMIQEILMVFDSPGGEITGLANLSDMMYSARGKKKVTSYVNGMAASAAYWIASASENIVMAETAQVGSIGVMAIYEDTSRADKEAGIDTLVLRSSQSPNKNVDPMTDEGKQKLQNKIDSLAQIFIEHVARNRGVDVETVLNNFGKGDVMIAKDGILKGMGDKIANITAMFKKENVDTKALELEVAALKDQIKVLADESALEVANIQAAKEKAEKELAEAEALKVTEKLSAVSEELLKDAFITPAEKETVSEMVFVVAGNKAGSDDVLGKFKSFLTARGKQFNTEETEKVDKTDVKASEIELPNGTGNVDPIMIAEATKILELSKEKSMSYIEAAKLYYSTKNSEGK